jgi:predicted nuclease of restriction endonuclease-like (RecB) superfamily
MSTTIISQEYLTLLANLKARVISSRLQAAMSANKDLVVLYHHIGTEVLDAQKKQGWGAKVIDQLSKDLRSEFPEMKGFSRRNLTYMQKFAREYTLEEVYHDTVHHIPWGHIAILIDTIADRAERHFYINNTIKHGWSRKVLSMQIKADLFKHQENAVTNLQTTLPANKSDRAHCILGKGFSECIETFFLKRGDGYALLGRQYCIQAHDQSYYIDLLFYHIKLRSCIAIALKHGKLKPEYADEMKCYLSAVDDVLRQAGDNQSIGLIICRSKEEVAALYVLCDATKQAGFTTYRREDALPDALQTGLPTIKELEAELTQSLKNIETEETVNDHLVPLKPVLLKDIQHPHHSQKQNVLHFIERGNILPHYTTLLGLSLFVFLITFYKMNHRK